jgi:hypothetical protein
MNSAAPTANVIERLIPSVAGDERDEGRYRVGQCHGLGRCSVEPNANDLFDQIGHRPLLGRNGLECLSRERQERSVVQRADGGSPRPGRRERDFPEEIARAQDCEAPAPP